MIRVQVERLAYQVNHCLPSLEDSIFLIDLAIGTNQYVRSIQGNRVISVLDYLQQFEGSTAFQPLDSCLSGELILLLPSLPALR